MEIISENNAEISVSWGLQPQQVCIYITISAFKAQGTLEKTRQKDYMKKYAIKKYILEIVS